MFLFLSFLGDTSYEVLLAIIIGVYPTGGTIFSFYPAGGTEFLKFHGGQIRHKVQNHPIKDYNIRFGNSTWEVIFFKHITF